MLKALLADTRRILKLYGLGALLFFLGIGGIQGATKILAPSLEQEVYVLLGVVIAGLGFIIAMCAQCLLIIHRFSTMGNKINKTDTK